MADDAPEPERDSDDLDGETRVTGTDSPLLSWSESSATTDLGQTVRSYLVELIGQNPGATHRIESLLTIGRGVECGICIRSPEVSRRHAQIETRGSDQLMLIDLGSANGTYVNGTRISEPHLLKFGDRVTIGRRLFLFTHHDDLEERLVQQQKMESLGRLAGGIAHDFNNLLGAVLANLSVLLTMDHRSTLADKDVRETIQDIETASRLAAELTQQLLSFARRGNYEERPIDLSTLTKSAIAVLQRTFGPHVHLETDIEDGQIVVGDRSQLHQVLMSLLINARDALNGQGLLRVSLRRALAETLDPAGAMRGPCAILSISDSGSGMDAETKRRVFEPFFTSKELGQGTGLGLAMVYGVAKNHGGDIIVESQVGKGTTFKLILPATWIEASGDADIYREDTIPPIQTILLVDDDHLFVRSTQRMLHQGGYTAILASGGREAIEVYRKMHEGIDLVMIDLMMPSMSGEQVCRSLVEFNPNVRILAVSGFSETERVRGVMEAGAVGFLKKPFERGELERALAAAMGAVKRTGGRLKAP